MAIVAKRFDLGKSQVLDEIQAFFRSRALDRSQIILAETVQVAQGNSAFILVYEDVSPPSVSGTSPSNGASNVPVGSTIFITMSEPIQDPTSEIAITKAGSPVVGFTVTPAGGSWPDSQFTITNAIDSTYNTLYTVVLGEDILDVVGHPMGEDYLFTFTTTNQAAGMIFREGSVTPDAGEISAGYVDIVFASGYNFPDANYRLSLSLSGGTAQPGITLRATNKATSGFRIAFDVEDFATVEAEIDTVVTELETNLDTDYTSQINSQHASGTHAAPQNALSGLSVTAHTAADIAARAFQTGNFIDWKATHGAPS
jgi:hypothetical protein